MNYFQGYDNIYRDFIAFLALFFIFAGYAVFMFFISRNPAIKSDSPITPEIELYMTDEGKVDTLYIYKLR